MYAKRPKRVRKLKKIKVLPVLVGAYPQFLKFGEILPPPESHVWGAGGYSYVRMPMHV
jgi:hypothetical protein